jgi:hypothetical protein
MLHRSATGDANISVILDEWQVSEFQVMPRFLVEAWLKFGAT